MDYSRTITADELATSDMTGVLLMLMLFVVVVMAMGFLWEAFFG